MGTFHFNTRSHSGNTSAQKKLPPYGNRLDRGSKRTIVVLTGSGAWDRARDSQNCGYLLVLPPGDDPTGFHWPVAGRDCVVWSLGTPEPHERLVALGAALVRAGAVFAILGHGCHDPEHAAPIFRARRSS